MELVKTRQGQIIQDVGEEFMKAIADAKSGGKDGEDLFDFYVKLEESNSISEDINNAIHKVGPRGFDAKDLPLFTNLKPRVSDALLAWICPQSQGIPGFIMTYVGLYGVVFWKSHKRKDKLTLKWIGENGGRGKIVDYTSIFPWYLASQNEKRESIFESMDPKAFYLGDVNE